MKSKQLNFIKIDERNHVEEPLLDQLMCLGWNVIDLTNKIQKPNDTFRENFAEVVMLPVLRRQLKAINPWLTNNQVEEVVKQLTASFPSQGLIANNRYVLRLLVDNTSVGENRQTGERSPTVRIIDFDNRKNNRFIAVCQFKVRILGTEHHIIPDVVLFVNGLPLVVIECKSPTVKDAISEAINQLLRYSEQRGVNSEGSKPLFYFNQFVVATCRQQAKFGTITTHSEKHFYRWRDPYPKTLNDLSHGTSSPNDQQRLVAGMMDKDNLLDLIRTFTLFSTDSKGQTIKIVGRYQQYRAVKLAVNRLREGKTPSQRSGIIWHTQGSGKSLTMMFMVREMYRHAQMANWKIVFVTDRTQLENQLKETSQSIGFTVKSARSIVELKKLLRTDTSDLVMAMIHKFRESDLTVSFPQLNSSPHILVMTDEAHRSQYRQLGANLDRAIPNASKIGYTGTPIDKTEQVFGDYIDKYTMRQSIDDGVTLQIVYEGRTQNAEVTNYESMNEMFADIFSEYNLQQRLEILGYGSRLAYLEAEPTIEAKAKDMVNHYLDYVFPNGFKAQVVATSREAAVRYKKHIDDALSATVSKLKLSNPMGLDLERIRKLQTDVVISGVHSDLPYLKKYTNKTRQERSIKSFKVPFDGKVEGVTGDMGIIIVNNMLITGFDAPLEQVMYLDKVITNHNLLQAIARVNRIESETKDKGFVIDYVGIGNELSRAISAYDERDQTNILDTISSPEEELRNLNDSHVKIMALLKKNGLTDLTDHDAFFDVFYDEDLRLEYMQAFKKFTKCLNLVFPARQALEFRSDYNALSEINVLACKHFHDERLSMKGIPQKLRAITDEHLMSKGIHQKVKPISILDQNFQKSVGERSRTKTKAAEVEHAIRHHLDVELDDDPELQASFADALEQIFQDFQANWEMIYEELEKLRQKIIDKSQEPTYGLHRKKEMPFFRSIKREMSAERELSENEISDYVNLTQNIFRAVERELILKGFWESPASRNQLEFEILKIIIQGHYKSLPNLIEKRKQIISRVMEIAERKNDVILYAE